MRLPSVNSSRYRGTRFFANARDNSVLDDTWFIQNIFCTAGIMTIMQEIQGDSSLRQPFASSGMAAFRETGSF
jgi:hypothetical protein